MRPIEPVSETQKRKKIMCFFPEHKVAVVGGNPPAGLRRVWRVWSPG